MNHAEVAWEWVGTGVVGVAGIIATYLSGNRQTSTALTVAQRQIDAQTAIAREERQQARMERTYQELSTFVDRQRVVANAIRPFLRRHGEPEPVPLTREDTERVRVLVVTNASDEVRAIMNEFFGHISTVSSTSRTGCTSRCAAS